MRIRPPIRTEGIWPVLTASYVEPLDRRSSLDASKTLRTSGSSHIVGHHFFQFVKQFGVAASILSPGVTESTLPARHGGPMDSEFRRHLFERQLGFDTKSTSVLESWKPACCLFPARHGCHISGNEPVPQ